MTISLKHAFHSAKSDGSDVSYVQPSNWNAEHTMTMATARILGRVASGSGVVQELATDDVWDILGFVGTTSLLFPQASAPTGWTQDTAVNDRLMRVVSTAGGGSGGSWTISGLSGTGAGTVSGFTDVPNAATGVNTGGSSAASDGHQHNISLPVSVTLSLSHNGAWRPAYLDCIRATKN